MPDLLSPARKGCGVTGYLAADQAHALDLAALDHWATCPTCHELNRVGSVRCDVCGAKLVDEEKP